jgi:tetratricopeptide (TPR) repeat protein
MTYYRYSVLLAACFTCLGISPSYGQSISLDANFSSYLNPLAQSQQIAQALWQEKIDRSNIVSGSSTFTKYLQEGYQANANKDYIGALASFQKALSLSPDNSVVKEAIDHLKNYVYDKYMQDGYQADRQKNYQTALQLFLKAQSLRPDAFHAQQAVNNVTTYIAQAETRNTEKTQQKNKNFLFLGIALVAVVAVASAVLVSLLKSSAEFEALDKKKDEFDDRDSNLSYDSYEKTEKDKLINSSETKDLPPQQNNYQNTSFTEIETVKTFNQQLPTESSLSAQSNGSSLAKVDIVSELIEDLNGSDLTRRRKIIWELAQRADSRAMKPLVELMIEADSQERSLILEALSQIAARTLKPLNKAIAISMDDRNSQVRKNAIRDLTRVYELMSQVTNRLAQAVGDPDREVQETAKWALQQLDRMPQISQELLKIEQHKDLNSED